MRVGGSALTSRPRSDVGHRLDRLVAFTGMVDQDERATELVRAPVDLVVDVGHRAVVVFVCVARQKPVEGVEHDQLERPDWSDWK